MGLIYIVVGVLILIAVGAVVDQVRLSRHRGVSRQDFVNDFGAIPKEIPEAVYDHYIPLCRAKGFSVAPDDSFAKVFGELHDDVDDDAEELASKLGMEMPPEFILKEWPTPVETLRDMVLWLDWIRKKQLERSVQ